MKCAKYFFILALIMASGMLISNADNCKCARRHPQSVYQGESLVMVVEINKELNSTADENEVESTVDVVYKGEDKANGVSAKKKPVLSSVKFCDTKVNNNEKFIISGRVTGNGKVKRSMCGFTIPYTESNENLKTKFDAYMKVDKKCHIIEPKSKGNSNQCVLDADDRIADCQYQHAVCVAEDKNCVWKTIGPYEKCVAGGKS